MKLRKGSWTDSGGETQIEYFDDAAGCKYTTNSSGTWFVYDRLDGDWRRSGWTFLKATDDVEAAVKALDGPVIGQRVKCPQEGYSMACVGEVKAVTDANITIAWDLKCDDGSRSPLVGTIEHPMSCWLDSFYPIGTPPVVARTNPQPIPTTCCGCTRPNEYQTEPNEGANWRCTECRLWKSIT